MRIRSRIARLESRQSSSGRMDDREIEVTAVAYERSLRAENMIDDHAISSEVTAWRGMIAVIRPAAIQRAVAGMSPLDLRL